MTPVLQTVAIVASAIMGIAAAGCQAKTIGNSILTATVAGREIRAVVDGPAFIQSEAEGVTISAAGHKIAVERERVLLDGTELASLPADTAQVEVTVAAGQLTVTADGVAVITSALNK